MDSPLARIVSIILATLFLLAVGLKTAFPGNDPYRCRALQSTGRWIDPPDENGSRHSLHHWQPDGCILHQYDSADIRRCTENRRLAVVGDSTSRNVGRAFARLVDREQSHHDRAGTPKDFAWNMTYHGQMIQRVPSSWLEAHGHPNYTLFANELDMFADDKKNSPPIKHHKGPAMIYITAGPWYTQNYSCGPWRNDTEPPEWDVKFDYFKSSFTNLSNWVRDNVPQVDPFSAPIDPIDGIGNQIFFAPANKPLYQGDDPEMVIDNLRRREEITQMQDWLRENEEEFALPLLWSIPHLMESQNETVKDPEKKGFHVKPTIAEYRANILLNLRCNAKLDRLRPYPYEHTCCTDYGLKTQVQLGFVAACIVYLVACIISEVLDLADKRDEPQWGLFNMQAGCFPLALLMCYYSDRTQMMAKGMKLWRYEDFFALLIPCIVIALATIRRSRSPPSKDLSLTEKKKDQPFLSRDQTQEWKGWMQFTILIYHWIDAEPKSIYILIRLCVAAYLFQTGYGHTLFFLNKKDFSFNRAASVLLRLNLLPCALAYIMDTDYMFYYFSPLVSFWFLVVYVTMALGGKRYNSDPQFVVAKIWLSCVFISGLFLKTHFTREVFSILRSVFNIQWSHEEWQNRVTLDMFIVYVGMLVAVARNEMGKRPVHLGLRIILVLAALYAISNYFDATGLFGSKKRYRAWHPYLSFVPVLAFIAIRNVSAPVRNFYSKAMAWLGRCSLETYILQFHLLLAADTNGILIVDGLFGDGTLIGDRWRSLAIILPIFLWISHATASSTGGFVKLIMHQSPETQKLGEPAYAWLEKVPGGTHLSVPKIRIICILLVLWLLNVMSPEHHVPRAPNGIHHVHIDDNAPAKWHAHFDPAINSTLNSLNTTTTPVN
ncbi:hypothetical protein FSARC_6587 [Fusarium sarcochroum]|uniref:Cas1p 10 TM acyl transferase domain-containing protein n=1 Tax=Fusarium sarcochroum TaxID=1208366 RepID=A0A8H4TXC1_9HYPO|nr:hypothetical protein FSARC_6587 [Fusarium sarcochroum]